MCKILDAHAKIKSLELCNKYKICIYETVQRKFLRKRDTDPE